MDHNLRRLEEFEDYVRRDRLIILSLFSLLLQVFKDSGVVKWLDVDTKERVVVSTMSVTGINSGWVRFT